MRYFEHVSIVDEKGVELFKYQRDITSIAALFEPRRGSADLLPEKKPKSQNLHGADIRCGWCSELGHATVNCPDRAKAESPEPKLVPAAHQPSASEQRGESQLTRESWLLVRQMAMADKLGPEIAETLKLPLQQVNYAILCETYARYSNAYRRPA